MNKSFSNKFFQKLISPTFSPLHLLLLNVVFLATAASLSIAWVEPSGSAPNNNVAAPVNVGATPQIKSGGIWATSFGSDNGYCIGTSCVTSWSQAGGVPAGAVMAFDLTSCPSGWSEYTPARGRFLRGIDTTGSTAVDPSGLRAPGNTQADDFKSHTHNIPSSSIGGGQGPSVGGTKTNVVYGDVVSKARGGSETRPKNVAVLYCEKQ